MRALLLWWFPELISTARAAWRRRARRLATAAARYDLRRRFHKDTLARIGAAFHPSGAKSPVGRVTYFGFSWKSHFIFFRPHDF